MSTFLSILPIIIALVLYFTGIPIAYALFAAALTYFGFIDTTTVPYLLMQKFITSTQSFPFLAIPFFIMCGSIMNYGGISARLMDFADALTGHLPGGLAQINVLLSMLMGGCSGSANADAAMECKLLVPEMEKRGYGKGFSAAITAASSCVTPIIPPGINLIVYGLIAGASVGQLFAAGYIPGLLMAVTLMIAVAIISKKRGYAPSRPRRATLGEIGRQALKSFWALFFPLGIIMGMRFGIFTPTEAGGVGVLYCLIVGKFVYKGLRKEHFVPILRETISGTATVMLIIVSATVFGYYLNWENIPTMLLNAVSSFASNKFLVLLVMNVVLLIVGMFLEGGAALIILAPLMVPIVKAAGIDLVHFGIVCNVNIMIGGLTPPFGSMMFTCVSITGCKMQEFIKERIPSFDEYCEWASGESVGHNIEIKTDKIYYHDIERKIWATIERYGLEHKVMFSSFNHFSLRRILEISGNAVEVGALVLEDSIGGFPGYYCEQAGFACYHPPIELLTDENVRDCKEHGVKMNVWTVNDMAGLEQLHRWGCEGIITNYPGVASGWLRAQGE